MANRSKVLVIAEAGVNHNGSLSLALKLVDEAARAGADAVKFQTFKAKNLVSKNAVKADYQKRLTKRDESQYAMLKSLELSESDHRKLISHSRKKKIKFISSPFDYDSVDLLVKLDVPVFKIPSGEITDLDLLRYIGSKRRPVILSTGMSNLGEVEQAVISLKQGGAKQISLLHCVTEYPAPFKQINLRAMDTMRSAFQLPVGYSDHTLGLEISIAAVARGAEIIEKHFTLDRSLPGPDHQASLNPEELCQLVSSIRNVELAIGDGVKQPAAVELKNMKVARKSIVVAREIKAGQTLSRVNLAIKRPGTGIRPADIELVLGRKARRKLAPDELLSWKDIS